MNKFFKLEWLFLFILVGFFSCKNGNNAKNCDEADKAKMQALVGVWQITSGFKEREGEVLYPIHPRENLDSYVLFAFTHDGSLYVAGRSINTDNNEIYLLRNEALDGTYKIKGDVMSMVDKDKIENGKFILREGYLTTFVKDTYGHLSITNFTKVESPTIDEILEAPTE